MILEPRTPSNGTKPRYAIEYEEQEDTGCWVCTSHKAGNAGYPRVRRNGRLILLHRYVYSKYVGAIPEGHCVMHKCDNRMCINPDHLTTGTIADNNLDMYNKGRSYRPPKGVLPPQFAGTPPFRGEKNATAKLTEDQVRWIRTQPAYRSHTSIARELGVDRTNVSLIRREKTWKHLL